MCPVLPPKNTNEQRWIMKIKTKSPHLQTKEICVTDKLLTYWT